MWPWKRSRVSATQTRAEDAIASSLSGGDSLPAWNAIWDLVQSSDSQGKQDVLDELRGYVADSVAGAQTEHARTFERAIDQSMRPQRMIPEPGESGASTVRYHRPVPPSSEVRQQTKQDQIETHREAMRDIGVRPGDGIPMWALYMTRRSKRSWG